MEYYRQFQSALAFRGNIFRFPSSFDAGSYTLRTTFGALLDERSRILNLEGNQVSFTVRDTTEIPDAEASSLETIRLRFPWRRSSLDEWKEIRSRFAGSRYILWLADAASLKQDSTEVSALINQCLMQGRALTAAAILHKRYQRFGHRYARGASLQQREGDESKRTLDCFLETWRQNVFALHKHIKSED